MLQFLQLGREAIPSLAGLKFSSPNLHQFRECLQFDADYVPIKDANGKFIGVARGSQLIGRLVSALATAEDR